MRRMLLCLCLALAACTPRPAADDSLYRELGGQPGITRIVEGMLLNIAADPRIVAHFSGVNIERLRDKLVEQLCVETGGPCRYSGEPMPEVHKGLKLTASDFNALVEDLIASMDAEGISVPTQNRLLARMARLRPQIIQH